MPRAMAATMRRFKLFVTGLLVIVAALPLLPALGVLVIAETMAVMEREFPWVARLLDRLQASTVRHDQRRRARGVADLLVHSHSRRTF
jgi:hypothetical protein